MMNPQKVELELAGLKEISLPEPVVYTPQTFAWYIIFGVVLLLLVWLIFRWIRRWQANAFRRHSLARLNAMAREIENGENSVNFLTQIPVLVKWTVLQICPREEVARLSGEKWLTFLDKSYGGEDFSSGPGRLLPELAYGNQARLKSIPSRDLQKLLALLRRWIRRFRV